MNIRHTIIHHFIISRPSVCACTLGPLPSSRHSKPESRVLTHILPRILWSSTSCSARVLPVSQSTTIRLSVRTTATTSQKQPLLRQQRTITHCRRATMDGAAAASANEPAATAAANQNAQTQAEQRAYCTAIKLEFQDLLAEFVNKLRLGSNDYSFMYVLDSMQDTVYSRC